MVEILLEETIYKDTKLQLPAPLKEPEPDVVDGGGAET
eukprot:UN11988